ncbi:unnamed protein product [Rotaria magnacalcarata]|uniref:G-protein coupled receptors family 1 profile domain-containing protein n=1 Tax=Rotaria magnacalcarata TaxID=392030 RepID=A0A815RNJ7_9BILA|nr:unnamed protein product [Rotaria magnacalcarata]CAF1608723.1 unnamed protein product [Rotaria magnacalcarata]CAF2160874.1 unnamed protein product [Rotaria magnacalcarata]
MEFSFISAIQSVIVCYGIGFLLVLGDIGNSFVILIFYRHRKSACSVYLSSAAIINMIYLSFNIPIMIQTYLFGEPTASSLVFFPSILMTIFGYLAYRQVKQLGTRIRPSRNNQNRFIVRRSDRELLLMIFTQVFIYVISTMLYFAITLEILITYSSNINKSIERIQIESFIMSFTLFLIHMNHAANFYIYVLVSNGFRHDFKKLIKRMSLTIVEILNKILFT